MKELSIEQKAKAYDEVLNKLRRYMAQGVDPLITRADVQDFFPELKESEDERIRKALICGMYALKEQHKTCFASIPIDNAIAWLEKQGGIDNCPLECSTNTVMTDSKKNQIKPKFKVGDWCIDNEDGVIFQIVKVLDNTYTYKTNEGKEYSCTHYSLENDAHLWTIQDAKDGDVLQLGRVTAIFQKYIADGNCRCYCSAYNGEFEIPSQDGADNSYGCHNAILATKEQCDTLMKAMADAGYTFDFEKKELKKIEQKPTDKEMKELLHTEYEKGKADAIAEIQNHAWSEEDESYLNTTIAYLKDAKEFKKNAENCINWLKSLKDRVQPRRRHTIFDEII